MKKNGKILKNFSSFEEYKQAKMNIYQNCQYPLDLQAMQFSLNAQKTVILYRQNKFIATASLPFLGEAYYQNVIIAFELATLMGVTLENLEKRVKTFKGLPYRCELIESAQGVSWYNDSKATNIGACIAAVSALKEKHSGKLILMLSG